MAGRPEMWAVHLVSRVNHVRDLVGLMVAGCYHSVHPSMLLRLRRGLWPPVDPALVDAGREGELAVARTRIAIVVLLALNPAAALIRSPAQTPAALALVIEILFIALALTVLQLARRHPPVSWLGFERLPTPIPPRLSWAYISYGALLWEEGRQDEALLYQKQATQLNPDDEVAQYNFALMCLRLGKDEDLTAAQEKLRSLNSTFAADLDEQVEKFKSAPQRKKKN